MLRRATSPATSPFSSLASVELVDENGDEKVGHGSGGVGLLRAAQ
jgi:hypothetical protein